MNSPRTLVLILLIAFFAVLGIQVRNISRPPFDYHNFRQSQTLSTIELFAKEGIDFLRPRVNYYGEPGTLVLEIPIYQAICATAYNVFGKHIEIVRSVNLLFTIGSAFAVFYIVHRRFDRYAAIASAIFYICSPLNQMYMASILIDPFAVFFALWAFYFCDRLLETPPRSISTWILFAACSILAGLVKPLYLFGVCALIAISGVRTRKLTPALIKTSITIAGVGVLFLLWNRYGATVNNASFFTQNVHATMLLGFEELFSFAFVKRVARWILIDTLGPLSALGFISACLLLFFPKSKIALHERLFLFVCIGATIGYWISFAHITYYHDYYSLIAVPFNAMAGGVALLIICRSIAAGVTRTSLELAVGTGFLATAAAASVSFFALLRGFPPNPNLVEFAQLSRNRFEPYCFAMIFVAPEKSPGGAPIHDAPAMLYAAGVRGTANVVSDSNQALQQWRIFRPHYQNLRYVVFFGLVPPPEIVAETGSPSFQDVKSGYTVFELRKAS